MSPDHLYGLVGLIAALSVASERLVEIVKGLVSWLGEPKDDKSYEERLRGAALQGLAVAAGVVTAYLGSPYFPKDLQGLTTGPWAILGLGLLASGGSGLWNSVLSYLTNVKELKKADAVQSKDKAKIL